MLLIFRRMGFRSSWALWKFDLQSTVIKPWCTSKSSFIQLNVYGDVCSIFINIGLWTEWLNQLELRHLVWIILYNRINCRHERVRYSYEKIKQIKCISVLTCFYFLFVNYICAVRWNKIIFNRTIGRALALFQYLLTLNNKKNKIDHNLIHAKQTKL